MSKSKLGKFREVIHEQDVDLDRYALSYLNAVPRAKKMYGKKGVDSQLRRVVANFHPQNKKERLAKRQMEDIIKGKEPRKELSEKKEEKMSLSETEFSDLSMGFEEATAEDVREGLKVGYDDFKRYAERLGVPVEKVLAANPWTKDVLENAVQQKIQKAKRKVELLF